MRHWGRWIIAATLAAGGLGGTARANHHEKGEGQKVELSDLPAPVRSTFEKEAKGGQIEELRKEMRNGKTIYEGEVISKGKGTDIQVSAEGKVLERSKHHGEATEPEHAK